MSSFGKDLIRNRLPLPLPSQLPGSNILLDILFPHFFVAGAAFPLKKNIMKPYSGRALSNKRRIYNYRISRARRKIQNSFGILVARLRILLSTIMTALPKNFEKITLACVALHNFIKSDASNNQYCPPNFVNTEDAQGI